VIQHADFLLARNFVPAKFAAADSPIPSNHHHPNLMKHWLCSLLLALPLHAIEWRTLQSSTFPGTVRQYAFHRTPKLDAKKPAALMVFQDGHSYAAGDFHAPKVIDQLVNEGALPPMILIFVNPGVFGTELKQPQGWNTPKEMRSNRSFEYDTLSPQYVQMLEKEILPLAEKEQMLSKDPAQRAICGLSSGGICAFTAAWERPDLFGKVMSHVGSFTNIRGGHVYPALVRKQPVRPIRVFLQDGSNDLDNEHGNWFLANQEMAAALKFRKYDYQFVTDDTGHGGKGGGKIFAQSLRWLWR
jgi:enterochelin esterase family protein